MCRLRLICCALLSELMLPPVGTDMCVPPTQHCNVVKHGMLTVRFEYVVWYLQEEEELCIWALVLLVQQHRTLLWH